MPTGRIDFELINILGCSYVCIIIKARIWASVLINSVKVEITESLKLNFAVGCRLIYLILMVPFILLWKAFPFGFLIMVCCDMQAYMF